MGVPGGSGQLPTAWWSGGVAELAAGEVPTVIAHLTAAAGARGFSVTREALEAWKVSVDALKAMCIDLVADAERDTWSLIIEFELPRRAVRPDAILLARDVIIPIEFKVGAAGYDRSSKMQVTEYAWDLRDFHEGSRGHPIVPVLVATDATTDDVDLEVEPAVDRPQCSRPSSLAALVSAIWQRHTNTTVGIDPVKWSRTRYHPTPGILEAAREVYAGNEVREISVSYADNLHATVDAIRRRVALARDRGERCLCFVTGVPGSGKTLVGLSAVHEQVSGVGGKPLGAYLSGNGPLVDVLRYAIATDLRSRTGIPMAKAQRLAKTFIQPVHRFVQELALSDHSPPENVVVFDEAQRAWDASQMRRKQGLPDSEAATTLAIMERAPGWSVVIALVGDGQEINAGEAGIKEWFAAVEARPTWRIYASSAVASRSYALAHRVERDDALELEVSVRSPRARAIAGWAEAVTAGQLVAAKEFAADFEGFPLCLTRELSVLRDYLRDRARPDRRPGLLASSQARRLRPFGIEMDGAFQGGINWPRWFVDGPGDIRSSYALEVAASEFKCQGLEIDYAGLCWGSDFTWEPNASGWQAFRLRGNRWQRDGDMQHARNRYRVLLTRARYGLVIWVPRPQRELALVDAAALDHTATALLAAGCTPIE